MQAVSEESDEYLSTSESLTENGETNPGVENRKSGGVGWSSVRMSGNGTAAKMTVCEQTSAK